MKLHYHSIWISDVHLGTKGCRAEFLLDFLQHVECDTLYMVGDIIDMWKFRSGVYWPDMHNRVVHCILNMAKNGTRVIYVPGNHDEWLRQHDGAVFNRVEIHQQIEHITAEGKRLLVLHGDEFDAVVCNRKWLAILGSEAYDFLLVFNRWYNLFRRRFGFPYWSISAYIKHKVKNAVDFIHSFEDTLMYSAKQRGFDGVVCGHIHHAAVRDSNGLLYANCGDWVESCTALVETVQGELEILRWAENSAALLDAAVLSEQERKKKALLTGGQAREKRKRKKAAS